MIGYCVKLDSQADADFIADYVGALYPSDPLVNIRLDFPIYLDFHDYGWDYGSGSHYLDHPEEYGQLIPLEALTNPSAYPEYYI